MEILAPAGSRESLERAQAAGADAVYLGYAAFSARAGAGNFDGDELAEAIRFAHLHHMRVYVTVNTLVKDRELPEAEKLLGLLNRLRADGVLVQDLGLLSMIRERWPGLRVHASTQMAIHNAAGVRWCAKMGMKRVVLARECSLAEIGRCAEAGPEIEVFVHGAQCVSVSGECLFSSMVGERSGNRGRCAQPCRKLYRFDGVEGAWLSPRDVCLRDRLPDLKEAGVSSLKIEGRLKRPEYVYTVTESYRRGMDGLAAGAFRPAEEGEKEALRQIFHRGGFMEGYAFGTEDAGVIQPDSVNHQGIRIGQVTECRGNLAKIRLERDLHDGDGLRLKHGREEKELIYAGKDAPAGETAVLRLREGLRASGGDPVYRLTDSRQLKEAMEAPIRKIPVDLALDAWPGKALLLRLSDGEITVQVSGETAEAARSRETSPEDMARQLRKAGGTDFVVRAVDVRTAGAFVPVSTLNALRREGLSRLAEARMEDFAFPGGPEEPGAPEGEPGKTAETPRYGLRVTVRTAAQAEVCRGAADQIIWYPEDFREAAMETLAAVMKPGEWLRLPEVCEEETLEGLRAWTESHREKLGGVLLGSVGQLGLSWPVPVAAGPGIPVMNRRAARLLKEQGCLYVTASPELSGEELKALQAPGTDMPEVVLSVYGRTQLMLLHHCPARTVQGWEKGHACCALCDGEDPRALRGKWLEDQGGYRFPLQRIRLPEGCLVRLLNALPVDLGEKRTGLSRCAELTTETPEEAAAVLRAVDGFERSSGESTRGHWNRPVL